ncbi:MAG: spermidine synthase, partial [Myxococcota bacterium]
PMSSRAAAALVFVTSAAVLVLETLAGRLLAPYAGVTLETFTAIIGTILAGISLGAWLGGRAADAGNPGRLLGPLIAAGGALSMLSIFMIDVLGPGATRNGGISSLGLVMIVGAAFFLPAAALSAVSPIIVKLTLDDIQDTGSIVGRLSAIGTAGAIVGTFVTGFVLVSNFPSRPTLRGVAAGLIVLGLVIAARNASAKADLGKLSVVAVVLTGVSLLTSGPCEYESPYFCATIEDDPDRPSGRLLRLDTLSHSYVDLDDPTYLEFSYAQALDDVLAVTFPEPQPITAIHIGGGGFTFPRFLEATRPGTQSTVLELDPLLVELARTELGFTEEQLGFSLAGVEVATGDGRLTLAQLPNGAADIVIGDAFGGVSVPWHLTTREFVQLVKSKLTQNGVYALNMIDYGPRDFARAEMATLASVFKHVAAFTPADRLGPRNVSAGGNFVLVASDAPIDVAGILARNAADGDDEAAISTLDGSLAAFVGDAVVLLDDHAPVDQLLTPLP